MIEVLESKLQQLAEDELMLDAIKFVITQRIEKEKPDINETDDNKIVGEKYRAYEQAKDLLDKSLIDIDSYKNKKVGSDKFNKGK